MIIKGTITNYDLDSGAFTITAPYPNVMDVARKQYHDVEIRLNDGRTINNEQRRKARAIIADICNWAGYDIRSEADNIHQILKAYFCLEWSQEDFSLSNTDVTTAREYINYLIDFCLKNDVPCIDTLINRTDDIDSYVYACMYHRKCTVCGKTADLHHVDAIGMGNNREKVNHVGRRAMCLCRIHHEESHTIGQLSFNEKYHIYPVKLDVILVKRLGL